MLKLRAPVAGVFPTLRCPVIVAVVVVVLAVLVALAVAVIWQASLMLLKQQQTEYWPLA